MSDDALSAPPSGWYPDPGGAREWRVWNGREWSDAKRPYGDEPIPTQHSLCRYGVVAYFAGLGLLIDAYHHRPSVDPAMSWTWFAVLTTAALGTALIGHIAFTRATATLMDAPGPAAGVPILNVVQWSRLAFARSNHTLPLTRRSRGTRLDAIESAGLHQLFAISALGAYALTPLPRDSALSVVLHLLPAVAAAFTLRWAMLLRDDLAG
jgi:hypothetical protein